MSGRPNDARGSDNIAYGYEFFKGAFSEHILNVLKSIVIVLTRSHRRKVAGGTKALAIT